MDIKSINNFKVLDVFDNKTNKIGKKNETFENIFESIKNMVNETSKYNDIAQQEEMAYAMGIKNNTHDLAVAQQKANLSLQYTVSIRNHILDAYKEIMNMQF
ncbi:MAG TPA: flagellar hook-basal body complex protein FliE [Clostridiales bacterium]|nr:flagellar hook-basal body complex protein FliE [Clostridiales bacterium]